MRIKNTLWLAKINFMIAVAFLATFTTLTVSVMLRVSDLHDPITNAIESEMVRVMRR